MSKKLATLGVTVSPSFSNSCASQASQRVLCSRARSWCSVILDCRDAGGDCRGVDVERPADAVDRGDDVRRTQTSSLAAKPRARGFSKMSGVMTTLSLVATSSMPDS